jgi:hypothetical protein
MSSCEGPAGVVDLDIRGPEASDMDLDVPGPEASVVALEVPTVDVVNPRFIFLFFGFLMGDEHLDSTSLIWVHWETRGSNYIVM